MGTNIYATTVALVLLTSTTCAHAQGYKIVKIVDASADLHGFAPPALNDSRTLLFLAFYQNAGLGIYMADAQGVRRVVQYNDGFSGFSPGGFRPVLNNAGQFAFLAQRESDSVHGIFTGPDPASNAFVTSAGSYAESIGVGNGSGLALNDHGSIIFMSDLDGRGSGVFRGPDPVTSAVANSDGRYNLFFEIASNNAGKVAFKAVLDDPTVGIYTGPDPTTSKVVDSNGPYREFFALDLNATGQLAFRASLDDGTRGIFKGPDPVASAVATSATLFDSFSSPDINDAGTVAFRAVFDSGGRGIFTGPDALADKVIATGDELFGSIVTSVDFQKGLNNFGDVAFSYVLANGESGIAMAFVPEPAALTLIGVIATLALRRPQHPILR